MAQVCGQSVVTGEGVPLMYNWLSWRRKGVNIVSMFPWLFFLNFKKEECNTCQVCGGLLSWVSYIGCRVEILEY